jgi:hypothetical protein
MSYEKITYQLPDGELGNDRYFAAEYTFHGDVVATSWESPEPDPKSVHVFRMRDGAEAKFSAALIGYYARLGISVKEQKELLAEAIQSASSNSPFAYLAPFDEYDSSLKEYIDGSYGDPYDTHPTGLNPLMPPISAGTRPYEIIGGTGIYTRQEKLGKLTLVLTSIRPPKNDVIDTESFSRADIPVLAKTVAELSMGQYRQAVYDLYHRTLR